MSAFKTNSALLTRPRLCSALSISSPVTSLSECCLGDTAENILCLNFSSYFSPRLVYGKLFPSESACPFSFDCLRQENVYSKRKGSRLCSASLPYYPDQTLHPFSRTNFLFISKINNPFTQRQAVWTEPEFPG